MGLLNTILTQREKEESKIMDKLNPKVKALWLKALRSGKYKQGHNALCTVTTRGKNRFCCLGVLCDLYIKSHKSAKWSKKTSDSMNVENNKYSQCLTFQAKRVRERGLLPIPVAKWAHFGDTDEKFNPSVDGTVLYNDDSKGFPELNDQEQLTFKQIAKIVEEQL